MRNRVLHFLVVFLLFGNQAWSMDLSESAMAGNPDLTHSIDLQQDDGSSHDTSTPCDHCCHGSAHYVAILPLRCSPVRLNNSRYGRYSFKTDYYNTHQPPTPPPDA